MSESNIPANHQYHGGYINYDNNVTFRCAYCKTMTKAPISYIKYLVNGKRVCTWTCKCKMERETKSKRSERDGI